MSYFDINFNNSVIISRFCRGRNLMLNFQGLVGRGDNLRYKMDILGPGQIGKCVIIFIKKVMKEGLTITSKKLLWLVSMFV